MSLGNEYRKYEKLKQAYPEKFVSEKKIFSNIHRGDRIFISTACAEPQYLIGALATYLESHPKAFFDAEVLSWWNLGVAPYAEARYQQNFRYNSFFVANPTRDSVNIGLSDYTPIFLSNTPKLFSNGQVPIDVALIQCSPPDDHGYVNLGVSVDIVKAAVENTSLIIAQLNSFMPRIHGDGFIDVNEIDYFIVHDEPILEYNPVPTDEDYYLEIASKIGNYVARLIQDGDTIQVGYGSIPDAVLSNLSERDLGVHTELVSDGLIKLIKNGIINNSKKTLNRGKTIGSFCMGNKDTYEFIHDNPSIELRRIDYTNDPLVIARHDNMAAINSALQIDLTGQASAESIGRTFYSGIGGQADFMRGAILAKGGKSILTLQSTAGHGKVSRIVPFLSEGAGVTLNRGDIHYVVTEYGIAYLHGKNIRERAMQLISIAHPRFRSELIKKAKQFNLIYKDQAFVPGKKGEYPEHLETWRTTKKGMEILLRPVKISDEPLLKDFFYDLTDQSLYRRFISVRKDVPHSRLQDFCIIDFSKEMVIVAVIQEEALETVVGVSQYGIDTKSHTAEVAFVVRDDYQNKGIGSELVHYLTYLAKMIGLLGFTAEVLVENRGMLHLFEKNFPDLNKRIVDGVYELKMRF
ncbi:MAG: GNAT family N-acetyltransferase [Candidatus Heimdallarchaeota archaeon]|nr:MAG: GNAT family N-acetyltransferase [Candidatus Heimdallarchaeota archaeon]